MQEFAIFFGVRGGWVLSSQSANQSQYRGGDFVHCWPGSYRRVLRKQSL